VVPGLDAGEASLRCMARSSPRAHFHLNKVAYGTEEGLCQAAGFETIACSPGDIHQAHTANELVEGSQIRASEVSLDSLVFT
jgi:acetylornithine deacetylase/succinyl-diaminopimelate desuccinylase-like protein